MNILFLSCWYPSKRDNLRGIFIKNHAAAIKTAGNTIIVIALDIAHGNGIFHKENSVFVDENGIETHLLSIRSRFYKWIYINPFFIRNYFFKYYQNSVAGKFQPTVVHSNILYPCAVAGDYLCNKLALPHIITEHWSKVDKYMRKNLFSNLGKKAYGNASAITVVSSYLKESLKKHIQNPDKIYVVPNTIDYSIFNFKEKTKQSETIVFTAIATWKAPKRPALFIGALNEIQKSSQQHIVLNMIGDGPQLDEIKTSKLNFKIIFLGNVDRKTIAKTLQDSNYFLHASSIETFSLVVAEALATGTPVACSNVGALPELVNETNGIRIENTETAWTEGISKLMTGNYTNEKISNDSASKYSKQFVGDAFNKIYSSIKLKVK